MSDSHTIDLIRQGGQPELGKIYETYRKEFLHWITREYHCSEDDSKDIYQVTILILHDNIKAGKLTDMGSSLKTYLFAIGKNIARETIRKAQRNTPIAKERWLREYLIDETEDPTYDTIFSVATRALNALGEPCRRLIEMYYYERKNMEDISIQLHYKNADTAKNQKCKCMARLRKLVERDLTETRISSTL